jgi:hypothetical protein
MTANQRLAVDAITEDDRASASQNEARYLAV